MGTLTCAPRPADILDGQHRAGFQILVLSHLWKTRCFVVFVEAAGVACPGFSCTVAEPFSAWVERGASRCAVGSGGRAEAVVFTFGAMATPTVGQARAKSLRLSRSIVAARHLHFLCVSDAYPWLATPSRAISAHSRHGQSRSHFGEANAPFLRLRLLPTLSGDRSWDFAASSMASTLGCFFLGAVSMGTCRLTTTLGGVCLNISTRDFIFGSW